MLGPLYTSISVASNQVETIDTELDNGLFELNSAQWKLDI